MSCFWCKVLGEIFACVFSLSQATQTTSPHNAKSGVVFLDLVGTLLLCFKCASDLRSLMRTAHKSSRNDHQILVTSGAFTLPIRTRHTCSGYVKVDVHHLASSFLGHAVESRVHTGSKETQEC
eukprot:1451897-Amphidinium_carterae.1